MNAPSDRDGRPVTCLVWNLDGTFRDTAAPAGGPLPNPDAVRALHLLDRRGILHAATGRGEQQSAEKSLARQGIGDLFAVLEVGRTGPAAVARIADELELGLDTVAFVDDDPVGRAQVASALPVVRCYSAGMAARLPTLPELTPFPVTEEDRLRRHRYRAERQRRAAEAVHPGSPATFLVSLGLELTVRRVVANGELPVPPDHLTSTGRPVDRAELRRLCAAPDHEVLVASLGDRFGSYGTVGLAVVARRDTDDVLRLLVMSHRVLSRGAGEALLDHLVTRSLAAGRRPVAELVPTPANRRLLVPLRFSGFEVVTAGERMTLAVDPTVPRVARRHLVSVLDEHGPRRRRW